MLTLGIHDGHTATACLLEDGEVIACISEERINRQKEWAGFPRLALERCLEITGKKPHEVQAVGVCSLMPQIGHADYCSPAFHRRLFSYAVRVLPQRTLQNPRNIRAIHKLAGPLFGARRRYLLQEIANLGISTADVSFFEHHLLHAATTYYTSWFRDRTNLVITLDGSGDAICATINIGEDGHLTRIEQIFNYNSICDLYTRVTQFLGMKPMSHEYKVMGMAPYAFGYGLEEAKKCFRAYFSIDPNHPLSFINTSGAWKWQFDKRLERDLKGQRFDTISGAVQGVYEEVITAWIRNAIAATGIGDVALSGGGFMNVKLNYLISRLPEVRSLSIFPSCGDESNPIGASILAALKHGFPAQEIKSLQMIDWGPSYSDQQVGSAVDKLLSGKGLKVACHDDMNRVVAERIAQGKVVGRFTGRMEWGARALGNRSILADARHPQIIHKINKAIKMRDFWMPFAPAILSDYRNRYLRLRDDFPCPFMTIAPETNDEAWQAIPAGLHPFDRTARAQVLERKSHPSFYDLVTKYERVTGVGGVLNTSFNLHGDPIVCSPEDAIDTFLKSDLDVLQLEQYLIEKSSVDKNDNGPTKGRADKTRGGSSPRQLIPVH